jgi:hypothetical protein
MSVNSDATVIPRMKASKMSKKMSFSRQKSEERQMNNLQWNARGLSSPKLTEIKKTVNEENNDVLVINETNVTKENIKFYNTNGYTIYALYKSRQIESGNYSSRKKPLLNKILYN